MFPEIAARSDIDAKLEQAGWVVQDYKELNLAAAKGIAVREFPLKKRHGSADYLLFIDRKPVGVLEAKRAGETLTGVEVHTEKYSTGLPDTLSPPVRPLPLLYQSTGVETQFTNTLDPEPSSRDLFTFHRPETLFEWLGSRTSGGVTPTTKVAETSSHYDRQNVKARLRNMPLLVTDGMRECQIEAIANLEKSLQDGRRRSLLQMQTGSGKTYTAVASTYRLIKHAGAKRVLFLVDRGNLGKQTLKEFQQYVTPDDGRKFTELYNVQLLTSNKIDPVAKVVITTIQRLYAILQGRAENEEIDEETTLTGLDLLRKEPVPVSYQPHLPVEYFASNPHQSPGLRQSALKSAFAHKDSTTLHGH